MKQKIIASLLFVFFIASLFAKGDSSLVEFNKQLDATGLLFIMPTDFKPCKIVENDDVLYNYAIKHKNKKIEIRYSIFSAKDYNQRSDVDHAVFTLAVIENIAGDTKNILRSTQFDKNAVKSEFNADFGSSVLVNPESSYGKGYKQALIVTLFKNNVGSVYVVYLCDNIFEIQNDFDKTFHSIKFK